MDVRLSGRNGCSLQEKVYVEVGVESAREGADLSKNLSIAYAGL